MWFIPPEYAAMGIQLNWPAWRACRGIHDEVRWATSVEENCWVCDSPGVACGSPSVTSVGGDCDGARETHRCWARKQSGAGCRCSASVSPDPAELGLCADCRRELCSA